MKKINCLKPLLLLIIVIISAPRLAFAQDEKATLKLQLGVVDSVKVCKAFVLAGDKPAKDVDVKFYAKRMFSLLPLGKAVTTDEQGMASINFPTTLPGNKEGMVTIIAKVEDNDTYGSLEAKDSVKWGKVVSFEEGDFANRSLSASRDKAPMYLIIASNSIIIGIWGTLVFVTFQLFRIKRARKKSVKI